MNKRGMELAVNTLVVLILGIVILGGALTLVYSVYEKAVEIPIIVNQQSEEQLFKMLLSSDEKVAALDNVKKVRRKETVLYPIAFQNHLSGDERKFNLTMELNSVPTGVQCTGPTPNVCPIQYVLGTVYTLPRYESKAVYVGLQIPKEVKTGEYIYTVNVMDVEATPPEVYARTKVHAIVE